MAKDFFIKESQLDDFQLELLNRTLDRSLVVSGCAGSGKSVIALHKAKRIQNEYGNDYTIIVYTKALSRYMNSGRNAIGLNNDFTYHWDWKNRKYCPKADYIIVDEIQDFTREEINEFKLAARKHFFFFGDTAQSIFGKFKNTPSIRDIAYEANLSEMPLYFNYRLPKTVARITESYIGVGTRYSEGTYKSEENEIPRIINYPSFEMQLEAIARIIKNRHLTDVGILFPRGDLVKKASEYFKQKSLNVEVQYNDNKDFRNSKNDLNFESTNPKIMTFHSAKGLQFETVFIPDCTMNGDEDERKALYVAMTRTCKNLYIMYSSKLSTFFDAVPENLHKTSEFDTIDEI